MGTILQKNPRIPLISYTYIKIEVIKVIYHKYRHLQKYNSCSKKYLRQDKKRKQRNCNTKQEFLKECSSNHRSSKVHIVFESERKGH